MAKDFTATISSKSTRYQDWINVLGTDHVHVKSPIPHRAAAPGIPSGLFYHIDLELLSEEQRSRLIKHLATRFEVPEQEVAENLDTIGCPILDDDVTISVSHPQRWF